ncbi:MAG: hypothetical protein ABW164_02645 [Sphingobium sp.]
MWCPDGIAPLRIWACTAAALAALLAPQSLAQPRIELPVDQSIFLSDNPFLLPGRNTGAAALEIAVRPTLDWQIGPSTTLEVDGAARLRQYLRRYGDYMTGRVDAVVRHRDSEYLSLRGAVGYARELPIDAMTDSLDAALDTRSLRQTQSARLYADWSPSAVMTVNAAVGAMRTRFSGSAILQTTKSYDASVAIARRLSARTILGIQGQIARISGEDLGARTARTLQLTATRRLSDAWRLEARAGVEWAGSERLSQGGGRDRPRFAGSGTVCRETTRLDLCLTGSMRSEVSALTGLRRELTLGADAELRLTERGTLFLSGDYQKARGGVMPLDLFRVSAAYERRLSQRFSLRGGVDYMRRGSDFGGAVGRDRIGAAVAHVTLIFRGFRR